MATSEQGGPEAPPPEEAEVPPEAEAPSPEAEAQPEAEAPAAEAAPAEDKPTKEEVEQSEVEQFLGPNVRTPTGIPKDYKPTDTSIHEMLQVELGDFAGPLDLLLYLIRRHELDIFDIPIGFITERYLEMLDALKSLEVDIAAEFLVLAAELTHIKSKMLLPAKEGIAVDEEDEDVGDPREELVRRLLEYQKYRDAAHQLGDRDRLGRDVFARNPGQVDMVDDLDPGLKQVSIFKLVELMAKLLAKAPVHHEVEFEQVSIVERIQYVMAFGDAREGKFTLGQLLDGMVVRGEIIVTFIAILEMTKLGLTKILVEDLPTWRSSMPKKNEDAPVFAAPVEEEPLPVPEPADEAPEGSAEAAKRLAAELEAEAPELEALSSIGEAEEPAAENGEAPTPPEPAWKDDPLPDIWVHFTGKRFEGDILDDYR